MAWEARSRTFLVAAPTRRPLRWPTGRSLSPARRAGEGAQELPVHFRHSFRRVCIVMPPFLFQALRFLAVPSHAFNESLILFLSTLRAVHSHHVVVLQVLHGHWFAVNGAVRVAEQEIFSSSWPTAVRPDPCMGRLPSQRITAQSARPWGTFAFAASPKSHSSR